MIIKDLNTLAIEIAQGNVLYYRNHGTIHALDFDVRLSYNRTMICWSRQEGLSFTCIFLDEAFNNQTLATEMDDLAPLLKRGMQFPVSNPTNTHAYRNTFWMIMGYDNGNYICQWFNVSSTRENSSEYRPGVKGLFDRNGKGIRRLDTLSIEPIGHNIDFTQTWEPR